MIKHLGNELRRYPGLKMRSRKLPLRDPAPHVELHETVAIIAAEPAATDPHELFHPPRLTRPLPRREDALRLTLTIDTMLQSSAHEATMVSGLE